MREELRVELSTLGPRGRGRAYPKGLLEKLLSYTVARRRQGASIVEVAGEVGINFRTLARWLGARIGFRRHDTPDALLPRGPGSRGVVPSSVSVNGMCSAIPRAGIEPATRGFSTRGRAAIMLRSVTRLPGCGNGGMTQNDRPENSRRTKSGPASSRHRHYRVP